MGTFSIQSCRSCYATQHLCKKNVFKIVLIIVNINKDENKSLISNKFSLKNDSPPQFLGELFCGGKD
jgi:hypothetical protein